MITSRIGTRAVACVIAFACLTAVAYADDQIVAIVDGVDLGPILALVPTAYRPIAAAVVSLIALAAALATLFPAPGPASSAAYVWAYRIVNWLGCNWGRAANAGGAPPAPRAGQDGFATPGALAALAVAGVLALTLGGCTAFYSAVDQVDAALADPRLEAEFHKLCDDGQAIKSAVWRGVDLVEKMGVQIPAPYDLALTRASETFDTACAVGLPKSAIAIPVTVIQAVETFRAIDKSVVSPAVAAAAK